MGETFATALKFGKTGESAIAGFMKRRGFHVLPVYEKLDTDYKGPALYLAGGGSVVAPDMLVFGQGKTFWIEAKHKSAFTWHRITRRWVTGIDAHHFSQYMKVLEVSEWPVWLMFLHGRGVAKDTPDGMTPPCGLFGNELAVLASSINHKHENWGRHGMVYWRHESLKRLASLEEIYPR